MFILPEHKAQKRLSVLRSSIVQALDDYFHHLEGQAPVNLYALVLEEAEKTLLEVVLKYTNGNQTRAAEILGISRGTLRKKMISYE